MDSERLFSPKETLKMLSSGATFGQERTPGNFGPGPCETQL
jgi:hypothetical protein